MKLLFVLPRIHNNQYDMIDCLLNNDIEVLYLVKQIRADKYHNISIFIKESIISKLLVLLIEPFSKNTKSFLLRKYSFPSIFLIFKLLYNFKPSLIFIRDRTVLNILIKNIAKIMKIKTVMVLQQKPSDINNRSIRKKVIDYVFFPRIIATPFRSENPVRVKYLPIIKYPQKSHENKSYFASNRINLISVSKFRQPRKNHILVLKLIKDLIIDLGIDLHLYLVGELNENNNKNFKKIIEYVSTNSLKDHVTILTNLSKFEVENIYKISDLYLGLSFDESFSYSPLEAMSFSCGVVTSNQAGNSLYVRDGIDGAILNINNYNKLLDGLKKIMLDKSAIQNFGINSYNSIKENYNCSELISKINELANLRN